jgi:hypothetical protein
MKVWYRTDANYEITPTNYTEKPIIEREWCSTKKYFNVECEKNIFKRFFKFLKVNIVGGVE